MSDVMFQCKCGFKCVDTQLSKSEGYCPKCNEGRSDMLEKHGKHQYTKRVN